MSFSEFSPEIVLNKDNPTLKRETSLEVSPIPQNKILFDINMGDSKISSSIPLIKTDITKKEAPSNSSNALIPTKNIIKGLENVLSTNFALISDNLEENKQNFEQMARNFEIQKDLLSEIGEKFIFMEKKIEKINPDKIETLIQNKTNGFQKQFELQFYNQFVDEIKRIENMMENHIYECSNNLELSFNNFLETFNTKIENIYEKINSLNEKSLLTNIKFDEQEFKISEILKESSAISEIIKVIQDQIVQKPFDQNNQEKKKNSKLMSKKTQELMKELILEKLSQHKIDLKKELTSLVESLKPELFKKIGTCTKEIGQQAEKQIQITEELSFLKRKSEIKDKEFLENFNRYNDEISLIKIFFDENQKKSEEFFKNIENEHYTKLENDYHFKTIKSQLNKLQSNMKNLLDNKKNFPELNNTDGFFAKSKWNCASCDKNLDKFNGHLGEFKNWAVFPPKETVPERVGGMNFKKKSKLNENFTNTQAYLICKTPNNNYNNNNNNNFNPELCTRSLMGDNPQKSIDKEKNFKLKSLWKNS